MNRTLTPLLATALTLVVITAVACTGASKGSVGEKTVATGGTRSDDDGKVTVSAIWDGRADPLEIQVALNTHSVDLDGYDLSSLALARTDRGELKPSAWDAPKGGHHRSGVLTFDASTAKSSLDLGAGASYLELVVKDIGSKPERVLRWDLTGASQTNAK